MNRTVIGIAGLLAAGTNLWAGPLDRTVVPRNAQWVFHLDADAGLASTIGRYLVAHKDQFDLKEIDQVKDEVGIDPLADIHGVTVYGTGTNEDDGVAVVYATAAVDEMVRKLRDAKKAQFSEEQVEGLSVFKWQEEGCTRFAHVRQDGQNRIVVAAADKDKLVAGVRLLEGKGEAMSKDTLPRWPQEGSIVFASATHLPDAEALPFKHADSVTFDAGETGKDLFAELRVTARSSEEATNMSQVAMGAIAMVRMMAANNPEYREAVQLLNGVSVTCEQNDVIGKARIPSDQIAAALNAIGEEEKSHHRSHKKEQKKDDAGGKD
jgi:hypothetical protein